MGVSGPDPKQGAVWTSPQPETMTGPTAKAPTPGPTKKGKTDKRTDSKRGSTAPPPDPYAERLKDTVELSEPNKDLKAPSKTVKPLSDERLAELRKQLEDKQDERVVGQQDFWKLFPQLTPTKGENVTTRNLDTLKGAPGPERAKLLKGIVDSFLDAKQHGKSFDEQYAFLRDNLSPKQYDKVFKDLPAGPLSLAGRDDVDMETELRKRSRSDPVFVGKALNEVRQDPGYLHQGPKIRSLLSGLKVDDRVKAFRTLYKEGGVEAVGKILQGVAFHGSSDQTLEKLIGFLGEKPEGAKLSVLSQMLRNSDSDKGVYGALKRMLMSVPGRPNEREVLEDALLKLQSAVKGDPEGRKKLDAHLGKYLASLENDNVGKDVLNELRGKIQREMTVTTSQTKSLTDIEGKIKSVQQTLTKLTKKTDETTRQKLQEDLKKKVEELTTTIEVGAKVQGSVKVPLYSVKASAMFKILVSGKTTTEEGKRTLDAETVRKLASTAKTTLDGYFSQVTKRKTETQSQSKVLQVRLKNTSGTYNLSLMRNALRYALGR